MHMDSFQPPEPLGIVGAFAKARRANWPNAVKIIMLASPFFLLLIPAITWAAPDCPEQPPRPFRSDGCSMWPDGDWGHCCVRHDEVYWCGGTPQQRKEADIALRACVGGAMGYVMYWGVRFGGHPIFPTGFRWGFGWPYEGGYR